jgi:hypothetical protein
MLIVPTINFKYIADFEAYTNTDLRIINYKTERLIRPNISRIMGNTYAYTRYDDIRFGNEHCFLQKANKFYNIYEFSVNKETAEKWSMKRDIPIQKAATFKLVLLSKLSLKDYFLDNVYSQWVTYIGYNSKAIKNW